VIESVIEMLRSGAPREIVWGLTPRIVGFLYVVAFASLRPQLLGLIGSRGISPVRAQLAATREHLPSFARFWRFPTVLWLNDSDAVLRALPWLGMAAGAYGMVGGPCSWWGLFFAWLIYLSLDGCSLMFPWDCLLIEAGFLALFVPEAPLLPELSASTLPLPVVAFMFRFLLIRLMWGFAKLKFIGTKRGDSLYLRGFLAWMPICTPLGFRVQHAPAWLLRFAYAFMWFVEVICPGLAFFRGAPRSIAAIGLISLMAGIWATGNWGFFNLGYGLLCIVLFDTQSSLFDTTLALVTSSPSTLLVHVVMGVLMLGGILYFPLNSWATNTFLHWPFEDITWKRPLLRWLIAFYRELSGFRLLHAYGVFPPNSSPPIKVVPVFEGSRDGVTFEPYPYRYMPIDERSRAPIVAPHHPRIDHLCVYAGSGMSESDYLGSLVGAGKVFGFSPFSHASWLHRTMQRLLEGEASVLSLFGDNPFRGAPPRLMRVSLRALTPTSTEVAQREGRRWQVRHLGVAFAAREKSDFAYRHWLPPPELFHPDFVHWRRKSPALQAMCAAHAKGATPADAVLVHSDLTLDEVARFWSEFVPMVAESRGDFSKVDETARAVRSRFGDEQTLRFERIAERFVYLLRLKLEPFIFGDATPKIAMRSNFRFHLLIHEIILDGRASYEQTLQEPGLAAARSEQQTDATALHFIAVVRNETIRYHGRALRIARRMTNVVEPYIPGILELKDLITQQAPEDEGWLPICERSESGVWRCEGFVLPE
jgi:hypothetical protein